MDHPCAREHAGVVPPLTSLVEDGLSRAASILVGGDKFVSTDRMKSTVDFTVDGINPTAMDEFLTEALDLGRSQEAICETGNRYGVADDSFHKLNAEIIMLELADTAMYKSLSLTNQQRCVRMFEAVFRNPELRNRNVLHPGHVDTCVIGSLLNFFKHIFQFQFGCHGTDGNECLSLCLFSYRQLWTARTNGSTPISGSAFTANVVYFFGDEGPDGLDDVRLCVERIGMTLKTCGGQSVRGLHAQSIVVAMIPFDHPRFVDICTECSRGNVMVHVHIRDQEFRNIFVGDAPIHFALPECIRSISFEEGMFRSGYSVYRDLTLRDLHLDVSYSWQTAYMSPNEGGSGASTNLFADFCCIMLGWRALREIATGSRVPNMSARLKPSTVPREDDFHMPFAVEAPEGFPQVLEWATEMLTSTVRDRRNYLEALLVSFQREFLGGKLRTLETFSTGGGTRSINLAFESVIKRVRESRTQMNVQKGSSIKVLTGNPHLAVERAERRFQFELVRLVKDGILSVDKLGTEIRDPCVAAVYAQTLSYTDGITDPLEQILAVLEKENQRRLKDPTSFPHLVTLINDSCLAFSVLVHNGSKRVLDLSDGLVTPVIVTLDAHKHLGTDKGLSTVIGTPGTLSRLSSHIRVGAQPSIPTLIRAIASMRLIGSRGYVEKYRELGLAVSTTVAGLEEEGMVIVHGHNRVAGSTVFSVEDPSGVMIKKLEKKCGHHVATLFSLCPAEPARCQTGWQMSLTPYALRKVGHSGEKAVEIFLKDAIQSNREIKQLKVLKWLQNYFHESSLIPCLLGGNMDPFLLPMLGHGAGLWKSLIELVVRRFFTIQLDCGIVRSERRRNPLQELLGKSAFVCMLVWSVLWWRRRRGRA